MKLPNSLGLRLIATAFAWVAATLVVGGLLLSFLFRQHIAKPEAVNDQESIGLFQGRR